MHGFPLSPKGDAALQELDLSYNRFSEGAGVHLAPMIGALMIKKSARAYDRSTWPFFLFTFTAIGSINHNVPAT